MTKSLFLFFVIALHYNVEGFFFKRYEEQVEKLSVVQIQRFLLKWDPVDPYIEIVHVDNPEKKLFQTLPSWPFITIGYATDSKSPLVDGNSRINEWTLYETPYQNIKSVKAVFDNEFVISGEVWGSVTVGTYDLRFSVPSNDQGELLNSQLSFDLQVTPVQGTFNRVFLNYWCDPAEKFFGFGTQVIPPTNLSFIIAKTLFFV
jgi:hypothetical protein